MVRRRGRLREGLDATELVTRPMRGAPCEGIGVTAAWQYRSCRGRSRILVEAGPQLAGAVFLFPQLRRGRSGEPGGKGSDSRQKGRMRTKVAEVEGPLGLLGREEGGKGASDGRRDVLIPRESGGRPVRAPCPMRRSRFPHAGLPSGPLLFYNILNSYIIRLLLLIKAL